MGKFLLISLTFTALTLCVNTYAQQPLRKDKLYTVSGIGTSLPIGQSKDFLSPKISTTLGANLGIGNSGLFLYPKFNLHAFSYSGIIAYEVGSATVNKGRASTYLLNVGLGYRTFVNKFAFYGYAGGGGGFVLTPTAKVSANKQVVTMKNTSHGMPMFEGGLGVELNLGGLAIFTEGSYINGFSKIQERNFTTAPVTFGIKPNLSKMFK